jgi:hypothetical protein
MGKPLTMMLLISKLYDSDAVIVHNGVTSPEILLKIYTDFNTVNSR